MRLVGTTRDCTPKSRASGPNTPYILDNHTCDCTVHCVFVAFHYLKECTVVFPLEQFLPSKRLAINASTAACATASTQVDEAGCGSSQAVAAHSLSAVSALTQESTMEVWLEVAAQVQKERLLSEDVLAEGNAIPVSWP